MASWPAGVQQAAMFAGLLAACSSSSGASDGRNSWVRVAELRICSHQVKLPSLDVAQRCLTSSFRYLQVGPAAQLRTAPLAVRSSTLVHSVHRCG
jgi:hypothetical protein